MSHLFCFGLGYTARSLARRLVGQGWSVAGTATTAAGVAEIRALGYDLFPFDGSAPDPQISAVLSKASHLLLSAPPGNQGDPVLRVFRDAIANAANLRWIGYLSTVGVYGDWDGAWVDETSPARPSSARSIRRLDAEQAWLDFGLQTGRRIMIFRLAGIYGPGRSAIDNLREGKARRIIKPGQVFNRIHVEDIATVLAAALEGRGTHELYNVSDDEPAPPQDVIAYAAEVLGVPTPPAIPFASADLSSMSASFYAENKRVRNARIKQDLGVRLAFPTYREGLSALVRQG